MSASGVVGPDEGELHWLGGISARTVLPSSATEGRFSVVEHRLPPDAPPDLDGLDRATARYGLRMDGASLPGLVERFGLARPPEL